MIRTRLVWILIGITLVAFITIFFLPNSNELSVGKTKVQELAHDEVIMVKTRADRFGIHKGDAFLYRVEVMYDPTQVSEIDRTRLGESVDLSPFEIRHISETEFDLNSGTHVYQREYEIQLINGEVDHLYEFPNISVLYKLKYIGVFTEQTTVAEPIYVASRLPAGISVADILITDISNTDPQNLVAGNIYGFLRPLEGEIEDVSQNRLGTWLPFVFGGFLTALAATNLSWRAILRRKERTKKRGKIERDDIIYQVYHSLHENVSAGAEPKSLLHQIDLFLRMVLARKEKIDWLEEPDFDLVSSEIRPSVIALFEKCQKAYGTVLIDQKDIEDAMKQIREVLGFYFAEDLEAWKS